MILNEVNFFSETLGMLSSMTQNVLAWMFPKGKKS
jgi:hypothetical protein